MIVWATLVSVQHDWLDYLAAFSGAVGGLAALVALIFAAWSKRDAARSASAAERSAAAAEATERRAEEQVEIMRREAAAAEEERGRRAAPEIHLGAHAPGPRPGFPGAFVVLTVGISNDNGTRAADRVTVNLRVPSVMQLRTAGDHYGNAGGNGQIADMPDAEIGGQRGVMYWVDVMGPIDRHVHQVRYLTLGSPRVGVHRIEVEMANEDLPGGRSEHAWDLTISADDPGVELVPVLGQPG